MVGYAYQQSLTLLARHRSSTDSNRAFSALVPQLGYLFPIGDKEGYLNFKGYREFASENRPEGWNVGLTFISNAAPTSTVTPTRHSISK